MPFIYANAVEVPRTPNSLLVMPAHSLPYTDHQWSEEEYAEQIASLKPQFSEVVACIAKACADKGSWKGAFAQAGVRSIRPGSGLPPKHLHDVLGRRTTLYLSRGTPLAWSYVAKG
jgi:sialic acid synthase SpsE